MTRDRRGFNYALDPVCRLTEWEMTDIGRALSALNNDVAAQQKKVDALADCFAAARTEVIGQRQQNAILNIDAQRLAHSYMLQVQRQLQAEAGSLRQIEEERDTVLGNLNRVRKFADSLDQNKQKAAAEYDREMAKKEYQQTDDNWLQRMHWRKTP